MSQSSLVTMSWSRMVVSPFRGQLCAQSWAVCAEWPSKHSITPGSCSAFPATAGVCSCQESLYSVSFIPRTVMNCKNNSMQTWQYLYSLIKLKLKKNLSMRIVKKMFYQSLQLVHPPSQVFLCLPKALVLSRCSEGLFKSPAWECVFSHPLG